MNKRNLILSLSLLVASLSACVGEIGDGETFTRTIVTLHEDGTSEVVEQQMTLDEQLAEHEADVAAAAAAAGGHAPRDIQRDAACGWESLKLFAGTTYTGNSICFKGSGTIDLSAYCTFRWTRPGRPSLCLGTWAGAVQSYWTGLNTGAFLGVGGSCWDDGYVDNGDGTSEFHGAGPTADASFPLTEAVATANACATGADSIRLNVITL